MGSEEIAAAVAALGDRLIVGMPTDTVYGIAADPGDPSGVERLFSIKGRPPDKAVSILVADVAAACRLGVIGGRALEAAEQHWPGPLTLVVRRARGVASWIGNPDRDTIGLRVPDHPVALALLQAFGPLAVTSANRSGEPAAGDELEARAALGDAVAVYLTGSGGGGEASTVVDLTGDRPVVLRAGPIVWEGA